MNPLFRIKLTLLALMFGCCASASAEEPAQPATGTPPSVVVKVGNAIARGAHAAASGVERGAKAAARGIEHGATATANAAKTVAKKVGASPAPTSAASN